MTMITPSYLGETIEYSSLHACRSTLEDPTAPTLIREGHQLTRADAQDCGLAQKSGPGAPTAVHGAILTSPWAEGAGIAAAGTLLLLTLPHGDDPVSPYKP